MTNQSNRQIPIFPDYKVNDEMAQRVLEPLSKIIPKNFSITYFVRDLNQCREAFLLRSFHGSKKIWKTRRTKLQEIRKQARKLDELLDLREGGGWLEIGLGHIFQGGAKLSKYGAEYSSESRRRNDFEHPTLSQWVSALQELARTEARSLTIDYHYDKGSLFEWFVGVHLAGLFQKHFDHRPGVIKERGHPPRGLFLDFAVEVIRLLGIKRADRRSYTLETIATAFARTHKKGTRRESGERADLILDGLRKIKVDGLI